MRAEDLVQLGLSANEAKVYMALLEVGAATADKISESAGVHRRNVYDNLSKLMEKGMVSFAIRSNKRFFEAADPAKIREMLEGKKEAIEQKERLLERMLPQLQGIQRLSKDRQEINVYKGKEGVKTILWDILRTAKSNCVIGAHSSEQFKLMLQQFHKERVKLGIHNRMIFKREDAGRARKFMKLPHTEVRLMPKEYASPMVINIYGDKVGLLLRSERNPFGIMIENRDTAEGFRVYFNMLWNSCERPK